MRCQYYFILYIGFGFPVVFGTVTLTDTRTIKAKVGQSLRISYLAKITDQEIDYCIWTPPNSQSKSPVPFIITEPPSECGLRVDAVTENEFGYWKFIAIIKDSPTRNHQPVVEGFVKVEKSQYEVNTRKNMTSPWIFEAKGGVLNLTEKWSRVTCCTDNSVNGTQLRFYYAGKVIVESLKRLDDPPYRSCIQWTNYFTWKDNRNLLICEVEGKTNPEDYVVPLFTDSAHLNVKHAPKIVGETNTEGHHCNGRTRFEYSKQIKYGIRFESNPVASVKWMRVLPSISDRNYPYSQVAPLNLNIFSSELREVQPHVVEALIQLKNLSSEVSDRVELVLMLANKYGKCQIYVDLILEKPKVSISTTEEAVGVTATTESSTTLIDFESFYDDFQMLQKNRSFPILMVNGNLSIEGSWTLIKCCDKFQSRIGITLLLDRDQILSDRNFSHEEYFCIEKKLQVRWTHNENLLRCRTTLDGIRTGREDSMLIFVKHKPVVLGLNPSISLADEFEEISSVSVLLAANPRPTVTWLLKNSDNKNCSVLNGSLVEYKKSYYNATLKFGSKITEECSKPFQLIMFLENEAGTVTVVRNKYPFRNNESSRPSLNIRMTLGILILILRHTFTYTVEEAIAGDI